MPLTKPLLSSLFLGLPISMAMTVDMIPTEIIQVGTFHKGEVPNVAGRNWFALMVNGERAELKTGTPTIKTMFDSMKWLSCLDKGVEIYCGGTDFLKIDLTRFLYHSLAELNRLKE